MKYSSFEQSNLSSEKPGDIEGDTLEESRNVSSRRRTLSEGFELTASDEEIDEETKTLERNALSGSESRLVIDESPAIDQETKTLERNAISGSETRVINESPAINEKTKIITKEATVVIKKLTKSQIRKATPTAKKSFAMQFDFENKTPSCKSFGMQYNIDNR